MVLCFTSSIVYSRLQILSSYKSSFITHAFSQMFFHQTLEHPLSHECVQTRVHTCPCTPKGYLKLILAVDLAKGVNYQGLYLISGYISFAYASLMQGCTTNNHNHARGSLYRIEILLHYIPLMPIH